MSSQPAASNANPLPAGRTALLDQLTAELDAPALWWLSGYTAGLAQRHAPALALVRPAETSVPAPTPITVLFGSQTGNAKRLAEAIATRIDGSGRAVRLLRADAYRLRELGAERHLVIVVSTQGDGDAPDDARDFIDHLLGKRAPKLPDLKFAVLGLGDSSYPKFCEIGRRLDARLAELGASRWLERADADLDIDTVATPWLERIIALASTLDAANPSAHASSPSATITPLRPPAATLTCSREHPFAAELLIDQRITARDSERDVRHIELSLQDSGLTYEPGDALGVWPTQAPALVDGVLDALQLDGDAGVAHGGQTLPLRDWLTQHRELTRLNRSFIVEHAQRAADDATLQRLLGEDAREDLARALNDRQLIDLLQRHSAPWSAADLVGTLRPLQPRLYSIASSMLEVGQQAHLTV
ncbi:MAG: flavodoxin domain-containing protein, partial [Proteobacteria bacterium]|nr:flavodoxin domain-containing protein [Pseudomonadota bacterium]